MCPMGLEVHLMRGVASDQDADDNVETGTGQAIWRAPEAWRSVCEYVDSGGDGGREGGGGNGVGAHRGTAFAAATTIWAATAA